MRRIVTLAAVVVFALAFGPGAAAGQDGPSTGGAVSLRFFACGGGVMPGEVARASCSPTDRIPDLQVFVIGSGANQRGIGEAVQEDGAFTWAGLPDGEYVLNARSLPEGFDRFYVAALDGLNSPPRDGYTVGPNEGYLIAVGEATSRQWTINVYLIRDGEGWLAVDTGLALTHTRELWERLVSTALDGAPLTGLLCTHFHYDHAGLAAWMQERFDIPLWMTLGEFHTLRTLWAPSPPQMPAHQVRYYHRAGLPAERA